MPQQDITEQLQTPLAKAVMTAIVLLLTVPLVLQLRRIQARLLVLMSIAFVDMVGVLILVPIIPFYVQRFAAGGFTVLGMTLGEGQLNAMVVVPFTAAQLLSAPMWGRFSDRHGRRPTLLVALAAGAGAYLMVGLADSVWLLMLARLLQGAGGGTVGVIQSYVADCTPPEDRAKALGWLSAATNLGLVLGPWIGSVALSLHDVALVPGHPDWTLGDAAPGVVAAAVCALNIGFAIRWLGESHTDRPPAGRARARSSLRTALRIVADPIAPASRLIWNYAIAIGSSQGVNVVLAYFLGSRFGVTKDTIGRFWIWQGAISVFARSLLLEPMLGRFGEARLSRLGLVTLAVGLGGLPFADSLPTLALATGLIPIGAAFTFPCVTGMLSKVTAKEDRGLYMGLQQTYGNITRILGPLFFGWVYDHLGHREPYWFAAGFVLATLPLGIGFGRPAPARPA